jgi:hypothetical protein
MALYWTGGTPDTRHGSLGREGYAMSGTPDATRAAEPDRTGERGGSTCTPDGLLPPVLWGSGLLNRPLTTPAESDGEPRRHAR